MSNRLPVGPSSEAVASHVRNMEACVGALAAARGAHGRAVAAGEHDLAAIVNVSVFAVVWNADLSALIFDTQYPDARFGSAAGWRRTLAARALALTIVEAGEAFRPLLGHAFRASVKVIGGGSLLQRFDPINTALSRFRDQHDAGLREVRHNVIGHRQKDALTQVAILESIDPDQIATLGRHMMGWTTSLHQFVADVVDVHNARRAGGWRAAI